MPPKISVVMSVYNTGGFVREAVDSVFAQSFGDFEFIIIDDGSKDDSLAQLKSIADPRIRLIEQENRGLVAALNRGIQHATGQYIARMDGDDRCEPDRFATQVRYLDNNPDIALVGGSIATMDETGNPLAPCVRFPQTHEQIWAGIGRLPWVFCHPAVMYRRAAAMNVGLYKPDFAHCEDTEFFARLMTRYRAANLPQVMLKYRLCRSAVSVTKSAHGRINAELVAKIIDRWHPGEPFEPTAAERAAADDAIARTQRPIAKQKMEAAYHCRVGRELLRGRQWGRALRHYATAVKGDALNRRCYIGMIAAVLHLGGSTADIETQPSDPATPNIAVTQHRISLP
jgi:glycosyltransferase involved in cell wall biosynthesis